MSQSTAEIISFVDMKCCALSAQVDEIVQEMRKQEARSLAMARSMQAILEGEQHPIPTEPSPKLVPKIASKPRGERGTTPGPPVPEVITTLQVSHKSSGQEGCGHRCSDTSVMDMGYSGSQRRWDTGSLEGISEDIKALHDVMCISKPSLDRQVTEDRASPNTFTRIASSHAFNFAATTLIILNIAVLGAETNLTVTDLLDRVNCTVDPFLPINALYYDIFMVLEWLFFGWMCVELAINLGAAKGNHCRDFGWLLFDAFVCVTSAIQLVTSSSTLIILRVSKIYRLIRVIRVGRVLRIFRFLTGVRKMVLSVMGSLVSLMWAFFLMSVIMYIVAIIFLQGVGEFAEELLFDMKSSSSSTCASNGGRRLKGFYVQSGDTDVEVLQMFYGGLWPTMISLFRSISGGVDWALVAEPLAKIHWGYLVLWMLYVAFTIFGVLNILTGVFCDAAMQAASKDEHMAMQEMVAEQESSLRVLRRVFTEADTDKSGTVTKEEFATVLENEQVQFHLQVLGVEPPWACGLFELLQQEGDGENQVVEIDEFCMGCLRLRGQAKSVDIATLLYENKKVRKQLEQINRKLQAQLDSDRIGVPQGVSARRSYNS